MISEEIEIERLRLEQERLDLERVKTGLDQRFLNKNLATVITAIVSLAAVLVSLGQVWVAKVSNEKQIEVQQAQKEREIAVSEVQKDNDIAMLKAQQEREWNLKMAEFVSKNAELIFSRDKEKRERIARVIIATFPSHITDALFEKLENISTPTEDQKTWSNARKAIPKTVTEPPILPVNNPQVIEIPNQVDKGIQPLPLSAEIQDEMAQLKIKVTSSVQKTDSGSWKYSYYIQNAGEKMIPLYWDKIGFNGVVHPKETVAIHNTNAEPWVIVDSSIAYGIRGKKTGVRIYVPAGHYVGGIQ